MAADSTVIVGDCLEVMRGMEAGSVDLVFCDPPYNQGVDYGGDAKADLLSADAYEEWITTWIWESLRLLQRTGAIWVLVSEQWADDVGRILAEETDRRSRIIWRERFGQYNEHGFPSGHRHLFYHVADDTNFTWNPDAIRVPSKRMKMGDKRAAGPRVPDDVWDVSRLQGNDRERVQGHPCQLRRWPLERIVLACTNPGDTVLDPMCGSGTMGAAAVLHDRNFIGIELNADYARMAEQRIANPEPEPEVVGVAGQMDLFEET